MFRAKKITVLRLTPYALRSSLLGLILQFGFTGIASVSHSASAFASESASPSRNSAHHLVFTLNEEHQPAVFDESHVASKGSARGFNVFAQSEQEKFDKFVATMMEALRSAHKMVCGLAVLPSDFTLTAEIVSATWSQKQLCSAQTAKLLGLEPGFGNVPGNAASDEPGYQGGAPGFEETKEAQRVVLPVFRLPARAEQAGSEALKSAFLNSVAQFFCDFPLRPAEVDVKLIPIKVQWKMDSVCKKLP